MSKASIETDMRDYGLSYPVSKQTNADRIRNMNIAGLKVFIERAIYCGGLISEEKSSSLCRGCQYPFCQDIEAWLQAEVKEGAE